MEVPEHLLTVVDEVRDDGGLGVLVSVACARSVREPEAVHLDGEQYAIADGFEDVGQDGTPDVHFADLEAVENT